ncbi:hypothetical protein CDD83_3997 [Cordyceps sp. RAO-2017]|nr:hypothetical protein CDD83_3997 [Cordyceps sp. RAO-2017]
MDHTFAHKNEEFWNSAAESVFKNEWIHHLQAQISSFLTGRADWLAVQPPKDHDGKTTARLLDYACGNGIVTRSLHPVFSQCIGVDLAEGMLAQYRATAAEIGLSEAQARAVQGNLLAPNIEATATSPPLSEEQLSNFDMVAICMALHHVDDIELATRRLAQRLRPGGVLLIIDWATRDGSASETTPLQYQPHPAAHTISHDSFTQDQILGLFQQAGCGDSRFVLADQLSDVPGALGGKMQLFFARASKL